MNLFILILVVVLLCCCKAWHNVKLLWRWLFRMGSHCKHRSANTWSAVNDSFKWGVSSSEGTPHLKTWPNSGNPFQMGSHWRHRSAKTWSAVTDSFARGDIRSVHVVWKFEHTCCFMLWFTVVLCKKDQKGRCLSTQTSNAHAALPSYLTA